MTARSRNKRRQPGSDRNQVAADSGAAVAVRLGESKNTSLAQPPRFAAQTPPAVNATERSPDSAWSLLFGGWLIASVSTLGALFFSEVMELPPCVLCWYQRIFMFPLVLMLPLGLLPFDRNIVRYALPLAAVGWLISLFHLLLVAGLIPESMKPCTQGVSCAEVQIQWLGFVSIPLLSFVAFSLISALMLAARSRMSK